MIYDSRDPGKGCQKAKGLDSFNLMTGLEFLASGQFPATCPESFYAELNLTYIPLKPTSGGDGERVNQCREVPRKL
jgi:hypothetical protein